jgi:hypothetical protein
MVHKLFIDSRAAKEGTPSDFVWAPDRPVSVGKCRCFLDAVHMPVTFGTITETNKYFYIAEELPFLTVLPTAGKVYLRETISGTTLWRIVVIPPAIYDGPALATAMTTALGAGYTVAYTAVASTLGNLTITTANTYTILSRASMLRDNLFNGSLIPKYDLQDASDILGTTTTDASGVLTLGHGLGYRRIGLSVGSYTFDTIATELQTQLNNGSSLSTYTVSKNDSTGRLSISNADPLKFHVYPESYLYNNAFSFQGYTEPFHASDSITGFSGKAVLHGNTLTAASHVNVLAYHSLFINSTLGSHSDTLGPIGQSTIARKVVIDHPSFVHDFHSLPFDYITLEKQSISSIRFRVTDWRGHTVEMSDWSLSVVLVPEDEF